MSIKFLLPPKEQSQNSQQGQRAIPLPEYGGSLNYLLLTWDVHCCFLIKILLNQFSSIALSCPILCNPMDCSMPDLPVHHQHHKLAETHVSQVSGAIQPSHPLSPPSPPAFNLSQHQGLFQWVSPLYQNGQKIGTSASIPQVNIQGWFPLGLTGLISYFCGKEVESKGYSFHGDSQEYVTGKMLLHQGME